MSKAEQLAREMRSGSSSFLPLVWVARSTGRLRRREGGTMKITAPLGAFALAAFWVATAGARLAAPPSGDTCTANGVGPVYTLHITVPPGTQQFGFAFGAHGATVTNAMIPGTNGSFSTQNRGNRAANTSGVWLSDAPLPTSNVVTVTTSGTASSLTVVPANPTKAAYFRPITCRFTSGTGPRRVSFSVGRQAAYSASAGAWRLVVKIPMAGLVSARQLEPTVGTGMAATVTPAPLVQAYRIGLTSRGIVTLVLQPTPKGADALRAGGPLHVRLHITFDSADGRSASRLLTLTLRK
jgi:hypothetical protein